MLIIERTCADCGCLIPNQASTSYKHRCWIRELKPVLDELMSRNDNEPLSNAIQIILDEAKIK